MLFGLPHDVVGSTTGADVEPAEGPVTQPIAIMMSVEFGEGENAILLIDQREIAP